MLLHEGKSKYNGQFSINVFINELVIPDRWDSRPPTGLIGNKWRLTGDAGNCFHPG